MNSELSHYDMQGSSIEIRQPMKGEGKQLLNYFQQLFTESSENLNFPKDHFNHKTAEEQEKYIDTILASQDSTTVFAFQGGEPIGHLMLRNFGYPVGRHCATLALGVLEAYQGKGLGTQLMNIAFSLAPALAIEHIELRVRIHNKPAIALYDKCGFTCVGVLPRSARTEAGVCDELIYFWNDTSSNFSSIQS
jgi:ribosomal protein S18 acetylase RimI-like enzyme